MPASTTTRLRPNPFLHWDDGSVYNPLTDARRPATDADMQALRALVDDRSGATRLEPTIRDRLVAEGWLVRDDEIDRRFLLKYVSLEGYSVCNQACYFCPVAIDPREATMMPTELYRSILDQLSAFSDTIAGVAMSNYNEPTADPRFLDQVRWILEAGLSPAVLTNASGLTPERVDRILEMGELGYLQVNLSTLDAERYRTDRGKDHLGTVLRHLDYAGSRPVASYMEIIVLGTGDPVHDRDYASIRHRFENSEFQVTQQRIMDRAGYLSVGLAPSKPFERLAGCTNLGSRPLQHLHITAEGRCVLCCEDYEENHVVGDLTTQTVREVIEGPELRMYRRWIYGLEEAPEDFICRYCIFARRG